MREGDEGTSSKGCQPLFSVLVYHYPDEKTRSGRGRSEEEG